MIRTFSNIDFRPYLTSAIAAFFRFNPDVLNDYLYRCMILHLFFFRWRS